MLSLVNFILEKFNRGVEYENNVKKAMRSATKGRPTQVVRSKGGGSFSAHDTDMVIRSNGEEYPVEIKADSRSQMGGISIQYDYTKKELNIPNSKDMGMEDETVELIIQSIEDKYKELDRVIAWFKNNDDVFKHNSSIGFPMKVSQDAWNKAIAGGVIKNLNMSIKNNTQFINKYYKTKNTYYMQIGDAGLFYLANNPLKLDIPKLQGEINMEFRAGKSGIKYNKTYDYEYSTVVLRLQGRLTFKGKSPISIDTKDGAVKFVDGIENNN